jgi:hypothetical protein
MVKNMNEKSFSFLEPDKREIYEEALSLLEKVINRRGSYEFSKIFDERPIDVLCLSFTKVVNDTRAIILLGDNCYFIQAGIVCRSAIDACNLMMHIGFSGESAEWVNPWLENKRTSHWSIIKNINKILNNQLKINIYEQQRKKLDDMVHGNFNVVKYYPAQSPGPTQMTEEIFYEIYSWNQFINLFIISCLLVIPILVPEMEEESKRYFDIFTDYLKID